MGYYERLGIFIILDSFLITLAAIVSAMLVSNTALLNESVFLYIILIFITSYHVFSFLFHLNKKVWEYASVAELISIMKITSSSTLVTMTVHIAFTEIIDFRFFITTALLLFLFVGGSRFGWRVYRDNYLTKEINKKRTLIVGAGAAGTMVVRQLLKENGSDLLPIAFIDDDYKKQKLHILGIPVVGQANKICHYVSKLEIQHIIVAIPSLNKQNLNLIIQECAKTNAKTQILPKLEDLLTGKLSVTNLRDIQVEDLLGREPVELNIESISENITDRNILITGAGGSIGSEICRQIARFSPRKMILLGHGENSIYTIQTELNELFPQTDMEFIPEIADIQDEKKMKQIMEMYMPDVIYHAAAHKHVPLMEHNPEEAVKNNMIGTMNVARAAAEYGVSTFVMISSDKAVNPTSVMGSSKRLAEMIIQKLDTESKTKFVAVRFGNVLGSRGSVIPLFKKQIEKGGPVTVTDPKMIRYFMTIPEASRLVLQAGALAKGGEIFVLDMGKPVRIVDLAKNLIRLSGLSLEEIKIIYTGIRPGEKLFEELLNKEEVHEEQIYPNIYVGKKRELFIDEINEILDSYNKMDKDYLKKRLVQVANYQEKLPSVLTATN